MLQDVLRMLMGGHTPPEDVINFSKSARAADGLAGQVTKASAISCNTIALLWHPVLIK